MARHRVAIESTGTQVAFVHMSTPEDADHWFTRYGVADLARVSDPEKRLYRTSASIKRRLASWHTLACGGHGSARRYSSGHGAGLAGPNWRQLTGVFVVQRGHILAALRHRNTVERPDFVALVHGLRLGPVLR